MKPKKCPCGIKFTPYNSLQKYHSVACQLSFKTGKVAPENKLALPLQVLRDIAVGKMQNYIKMLYKDQGCYTCPETKGIFHGGHAFAKNQFSGMILNEKAARKVCDFCNCSADTDGKIMQAKIQQEIGIVAFIELENESITTKNKRWSKIEFIEAHEYFEAKKLVLKTTSHSEDQLNTEMSNLLFGDFSGKHHTIRGGNRFKSGDYFSPRVWSGKPYNSKQVIIAEDTKIENVWDVVIFAELGQTHICLPTEKHSEYQMIPLGDVAQNDGLSIEDFESWFNPKKKSIEFSGQIICWNPDIEY